MIRSTSCLVLLALVLAPASPQDPKWKIQKIEFDGKFVDPLEEDENKYLTRRISFEMVHIPGGKFIMGSPESEAGRGDDEGPQKEVAVKPFWMARHEVQWPHYYTFVYGGYFYFDENKDAKAFGVEIDGDLIPSWPYEHPPDLGMGIEDHPAMCIQWHKAYIYTVWLSRNTGKKFRLPTEAEWEYACRAGSTKPAPEPLGDYAWYKDNSDTVKKGEPWNQKVGQKKPNAFGLYDMLGGVWEYCQEVYKPDLATPQDDGKHECIYNKVCPHVLKGGSVRDPASELRAANRTHPVDEMNKRDPQIPKGTSWLTDGSFIGFRV